MATSWNSPPKPVRPTPGFRTRNSRAASATGNRAIRSSLRDICGNTPSRSGRLATEPSRTRAERPRQRVMRIIEGAIAVATLGLAIGLGSAIGFEGNRVEPAAIDCGPQTVKAGDAPKSMGTLQYAAEQGNAVAQWKLGRMYATGEGVPRCDLRAFEYFSRIANGHADEYPDAPQAPFVANAFVALGQYYLDGIPNSQVKADPNRAREMFSYAASYFGNADAQYHLARIYLDGHGIARDPRQAARWLTLSANKGQYQAQAMLGYMLFKGDAVPREAARALMSLTPAPNSPKTDDHWTNELNDGTSNQANTDDPATALAYLHPCLNTRRD